jgi:nicotinamide N-methyltransferase
VEKRTREAIKENIACDLIQTEPIDLGILAKYGSTDVIFCSLTLDAVAKDRNDYLRLLRTLASYLRQGGGLLMIGTYNQTFYSVGSNKFYSFCQDEASLRSALTETGFSVINHTAYSFDANELSADISANADKYFVLTAIKN